MTGRDAARDDLAKTIHAYGSRFGYTVDIHLADCIAGAVLHAGYRKETVTPEQMLAVVQILDDVPAVRFPETWMRKARHIARAFGLSVAEDGGQ